MATFLRRALMGLAVIAFAAGGPQAAQAQKKTPKAGVGKAVKKVRAAHKTAAGAQKKVESISDETVDLGTQYRNVERRIASLKVYNQQVEELLTAQDEVLTKIDAEIAEVDVVARQVLPLMKRMLESLEQFVELDVPFLMDERRKRVKDIKSLLGRADVSNAEKYRRVMEAYQIENEYGRTIEHYKGKIDLGGTPTAVEFLKIGRVALLYRSLDGREHGLWDAKAKSWKPLRDGYEREVMAGLRIAKEQSAPNLIRVPIAAPEKK